MRLPSRALVSALLATVLALPAVAQTIWGEAGLGEPPTRVERGDPLAGAFATMGGVFGDMRIDCVRCHGPAGEGDSSGAIPPLAGQSGWYLYKTLNDFATGRRPNDVMSPIARSLTQVQMLNLASYYAGLEASDPLAPRPVGLDVLQTGGAIAARGTPQQGVPGCSSCHGAAGGGDWPVVPALAGLPAPYIAHQLRQWKAGARRGDPMQVMQNIASAMTDEEIDAVAHYYSSLRPAEATPEALVIVPVDEAPAPESEEAPEPAPPYLPADATGTPPSPRAAARPAAPDAADEDR